MSLGESEGSLVGKDGESFVACRDIQGGSPHL
jgi:hypothetical protein